MLIPPDAQMFLSMTKAAPDALVRHHGVRRHTLSLSLSLLLSDTHPFFHALFSLDK